MSSVAELEWTPTKQAILGPDPGLALYGETSVWFHKLSLFRREENERMYLREPDANDIQIHKSLLLRLISDGEHLLNVIRQSSGLILNPAGIKVEDLAAALEALRDTWRGWHEPMPLDRRREVLQDVFGDVP